MLCCRHAAAMQTGEQKKDSAGGTPSCRHATHCTGTCNKGEEGWRAGRMGVAGGRGRGGREVRDCHHTRTTPQGSTLRGAHCEMRTNGSAHALGGTHAAYTHTHSVRTTADVER